MLFGLFLAYALWLGFLLPVHRGDVRERLGWAAMASSVIAAVGRLGATCSIPVSLTGGTGAPFHHLNPCSGPFLQVRCGGRSGPASAALVRVLTFKGTSPLSQRCATSHGACGNPSRKVGVMEQMTKNEILEMDVIRQCPTCDRCRDCGYTHIGVACPDPNQAFDGTCLCDPPVASPAGRNAVSGDRRLS